MLLFETRYKVNLENNDRVIFKSNYCNRERIGSVLYNACLCYIGDAESITLSATRKIPSF